MTGITPTRRLICALTLFIATSASVVSAVNLDHICLLLRDGMLIANDKDCTGYYQCISGRAVPQKCNGNLYFNKDRQQCVLQSQATCATDNQDPCKGQNVGIWVAKVGSCSGFYYCGKAGAQLSYCPHGENFDPVQQRCRYANDYPCGDINNNDPNAVNSVNLCTFVPNDIYFGSPSRCMGWSLCKNNLLQTGNCPTGFVYNVVAGNCDYPANVNCVQVTNDPELGGSSQVTGGPCNKLNEIKQSGYCNSYFECDGTNYKLIKCQNGHYFDIVSQTCIDRLNARNNCDRCVGSGSKFVNQYSNSTCSGYLFCKNGVQQSAGICPAGSYFDELAGACISGPEPYYGCCNPNYYISTTTTTTAIPDIPEPEEPTKPDGDKKPEEPTKPDDDKKPEQPTKPEEPTKPDDDKKPEEPTKPDDDKKPEEPTKPDDDKKPEEPTKPDDDKKPEEPTKPDDDKKPEEPTKPDDDKKPQEPTKPDDEKKPQEPTKPDDDKKPEEPTKPEGEN